MKKIFLSIAVVFSTALVVNAQTNSAATPAQAKPVQSAPVNPNAPDLKFQQEVFDFGNIKEGVQATHEFKFTNVGKEPLVISNVQASCGCTTPKWPKEPVKPGESGIITAIYSSKGRPGTFNKAITITSNAKTSSKVLYIKGSVEAAASADETMPVKKDAAGPVEKKSGTMPK